MSTLISENCLFLEGIEYFSTWFAAWLATGSHDDGVELSNHDNVNLEVPQERGVVPDVPEGNLGKLTSPEGGIADTTEESGDGVAEGLPQVEAFVTAFPHAVDGVGVVGLSKNLLEGNL